MFKTTSSILWVTAFSVALSTHIATASAAQNDSILTRNVVALKETVSREGFVHPGISCNAETLSVMREKVIAGVSPWVDYFEGLRRTRFANLNQKPRFVNQITNDGGIGAFAQDAQLAWGHTILYIVTGDEAYRKTPVEIINWYGSRTEKSFFPRYFTDSHIKIGKYVYTLCAAADILRSTSPADRNLAVTGDMIDDLQTYCILPIRENCIERNTYFMNQHTYAIMGYLASTIMADELEGYKEVVEWTTVNATTPNWGRSGSIQHQIREVTRNAKTGDPVAPNLQVAEMGRDQPHAGGNIDNLLMMAKTIDFQNTRVHPVDGTVTQSRDGVSPIRFLDNRLLKGAALFAKYNLGYGLPWVPIFSETDPEHQDYGARFDQISYHQRGRLVANGVPAAYHYFKGMGFEMEHGPFAILNAALQAVDTQLEQNARSGRYIDSIHNYAFDFWIGLPEGASDAKPDPRKAQRALAVELPPLEVTRDGKPVDGRQFEHMFVDLSANAMPGDIHPGTPDDIPLAVKQDPDGTGYVRMQLDEDPRTMAVFSHLSPGSGLRVRSDKFVKLRVYWNEDYARFGANGSLYVPDTEGEWTYVSTDFSSSDILYIEVTPLEGPTTIDFDRIDSEPMRVLPLTFEVEAKEQPIPTYAGETYAQTYTASYPNNENQTPVAYSVRNLPTGATFDPDSGKLSWTPSANQTGDYTLYITAKTPVSAKVMPLRFHVAEDLQGALDYAGREYDPGQSYESATERAFLEARSKGDLDALIQAAEDLALLNPRLPDGTLDYRKTWSWHERGSSKMADGDPMTWGGLWGFDKNVTMDFGNHFKVKADAFALRARDGFPIRVKDAVVYGSNDRKHWTLLTEHAAESSTEMQTLPVKAAQKETAYRFIRFFMPAEPFPIFEISELRIFGERIEDYSPDYHVAYIQGFEDGTFRPEQNVTRAEAASLLAGLVDDYTDKGAYTCDYADVTPDTEYYDDLAYMSEKKFIFADDDNQFRPKADITRGELASMMARMHELKGNRDAAFSDVSADTRNAAAIQAVTQKGWLKGDADGNFRPDASVTRAEFVAAANAMQQRNCGDKIEAPQQFKDVAPTHRAYFDIIEAATTHPVE